MAHSFHDTVMPGPFLARANRRIEMSEHHGNGVTRREVLIGAAGGLALAAVDAHGAQAQDAPRAQVSGIVFEDRDGSGVSVSNPGLPGVLVSNGRDVAVTGPDGR